jgi:hypothetical protein
MLTLNGLSANLIGKLLAANFLKHKCHISAHSIFICIQIMRDFGLQKLIFVLF